MTPSPVDVLIVGAGLSGAGAAHVLASRGVDVALVDRRKRSPDVFRAEKIEPAQAEILRRLDLLRYRVPGDTPPTGPILVHNDGGVGVVDPGEQYGVRYGDMVNRLRDELPDPVEFIEARVTGIRVDSALQTVELGNGEVRRARLVVVATGGTGSVAQEMGIPRIDRPDLRSLSIGFDIRPVGADQFPFHPYRGYNHAYPDGGSEPVDYVTVFAIGDTMRVNLFGQWKPTAAEVQAFRKDPVGRMEGYFPGIQEYLGRWEVTSRVQAVPTAYFRLQDVERPGVVFMADEYQSVSPTTGTGLDKVATDLDVLVNHCVPEWLTTPGMGVDKIARFYQHPAKVQADRNSLERWQYYYDQGRGHSPGLVERIRNKLGSLLGT